MDNQLRQTVFRAMGTTCAVSVSAAPEDEARARRALEAGQAEVAACERVLSRFDPASDLSALNRAEGGWVTVDPRLQSALAAALMAWPLSGTMRRSASGQARCRSQAIDTGVQRS